jgi:hypothetical protein
MRPELPRGFLGAFHARHKVHRMATVLILGVLVALAAPLLRRHGRGASAALAGGAGVLVAFSLFDLIHPDLRAGEAAVEESWRFAMLLLGFEVPVLTLALISLSDRKKAFWAGWIIHLALTLWLIVLIVWLTFFWHW